MSDMQKNIGKNQAGCKEKRGLRRDIMLLGNVRVLCMAAMFAAMAVVLGYLAKLIFGAAPIRVTFENLPIIFCGVSFGPFAGGACAIVADLASCLITGQPINPLITVGALCVGFVSGFVANYILRGRNFISVLVIEFLAHLIGSMILKSLALHLFWNVAWATLLLRIPVYLFITVLEAYFLWVLFKNKNVCKLIKGVREK